MNISLTHRKIYLEIYLIIYVPCGVPMDRAGGPPRLPLPALAWLATLSFKGQSAQMGRDAAAPRELQEDIHDLWLDRRARYRLCRSRLRQSWLSRHRPRHYRAVADILHGAYADRPRFPRLAGPGIGVFGRDAGRRARGRYQLFLGRCA